MINKKGQAAMEFLMTYGWAILAAVVVIGVLAYFGVFTPGRSISNACIVSAPFGCDDMIIGPGGGIQILLRNGAGEDVFIRSVDVVGCDVFDFVAMEPPDGRLILDGTNTILDLSPCVPALEVGDRFSAEILITYLKKSGTFPSVAAGKAVGEVSASAGGGGQVCGDGAISGTEICDGGNLGGESCISQGFLGTGLACDMVTGGGCLLFDFSLCDAPATCGVPPGVIDGGEQCDDTNLGGNDCTTVVGGFGGGTLDCVPPGAGGCTFDTSMCTLPLSISFVSPTPTHGTTHGPIPTIAVDSSGGLDPHSVFLDINNDLLFWADYDTLSGGFPLDLSSYTRSITAAVPVYSPGVRGDGILCSGCSIFVPDADDLSFTDGAGTDKPFSISMWVDYSVPTNYVRKTGGVLSEWQIESTHVILYTTAGVYLERTLVSAPAPGYRHIVVTYDGSETIDGLKYFIDGVEQVSPGLSTDTSSGVHAGMSNTPNGVNWGSPVGDVDETMIFARELTQAEVDALFDGTANQYSQQFPLDSPDNTYNIRASMIDSAGDSLQTTIPRFFTLANNPPVMSAIGNQIVVTDGVTTLDVDVAWTDSDGDNLFSCTQLTPPAGMTLTASCNPSPGTFSWTPTVTDQGIYETTFVIDDGRGGTDSETILIDARDPNIFFNTPPTPTGLIDVVVDNFPISVSSSGTGAHSTFVDFNNDLVLWYDFDTRVGSVPTDISSYGPRGTSIIGSVTFPVGTRGDSIEATAIATELITPHSAEFSFTDGVNDEPFSASFWINWDHGGFGIFNKETSNTVSNEYSLIVEDVTGKLEFVVGSAGSNSLQKIADAGLTSGVWRHVVVTYDGTGQGSQDISGMKIYIDKVDQTGTSNNNLPYDGMYPGVGGDNLFIRQVWLSGAPFSKMDEFMLFNRELTQSEIDSLFDSSVTSYSQTFMSLPDATYTTKASMIDSVGNRYETETRSITVNVP